MAIIYSYPKTTPVASDLLIISRLPSDPNETASYSVSIEDLASLISGTGTVTTFSATSSIPGITTTVTNSTTTPNLALSITGTPASGTYLDHAGNFTTPPGSGSGGTLSVEAFHKTNPINWKMSKECSVKDLELIHFYGIANLTLDASE